MKKSTKYIMRIISAAMLLFVIGNFIYGFFFDWTFEGAFIFALPKTIIQKRIVLVLYLVIMVLLFCFSFKKTKEEK